MGFVAHFVGPNWLSPTSQTPETLYEIVVLETMKGKESNRGNEIKSKGTTGTEKI